MDQAGMQREGCTSTDAPGREGRTSRSPAAAPPQTPVPFGRCRRLCLCGTRVPGSGSGIGPGLGAESVQGGGAASADQRLFRYRGIRGQRQRKRSGEGGAGCGDTRPAPLRGHRCPGNPGQRWGRSGTELWGAARGRGRRGLRAGAVWPGPAWTAGSGGTGNRWHRSPTVPGTGSTGKPWQAGHRCRGPIAPMIRGTNGSLYQWYWEPTAPSTDCSSYRWHRALTVPSTGGTQF